MLIAIKNQLLNTDGCCSSAPVGRHRGRAVHGPVRAPLPPPARQVQPGAGGERRRGLHLRHAHDVGDQGRAPDLTISTQSIGRRPSFQVSVRGRAVSSVCAHSLAPSGRSVCFFQVFYQPFFKLFHQFELKRVALTLKVLHLILVPFVFNINSSFCVITFYQFINKCLLLNFLISVVQRNISSVDSFENRRYLVRKTLSFPANRFFKK